jgi:FkbM family methyltransferase
MRRLLRRAYRKLVPEPTPPCDQETLTVLQAVLQSDSNAIDIGCNRGSILLEMLRLAPEGQHFAFEPIPRLYRRLRGQFPQVDCRQVALSDAAGTVTFNYFQDMDGFSGIVRREIGRDPGVVEELEVATERLDAILPPELAIALIKIDVEGAEYRVLKGAEQTLRQSQPTIVFECGKGGLDIYGHQPEQVYDLLDKCSLGIRLLADWSLSLPELSRQEFVDAFWGGQHYMFVASKRAEF